MQTTLTQRIKNIAITIIYHVLIFFLVSRFQEKRWKALQISHFVLLIKLTSSRKINRIALWVYKHICFIANIQNNNNNKFQSCEDILSAGMQVSSTHE